MKIFLYIVLSLNLLIGSVLNSDISYEKAIEIAKKENKKVLIFMYSQFCPWCEKMKKTTLSNKKVIEYINSRYIFVKLDTRMDEYPPKLKPRFIPTTYVLDPNTEETIQEIYGYKSSESFIDEFWDSQ
jgi:thioredoxin-related protein